MERISWVIINLITFLLATSSYMYMSNGTKAQVPFISPVKTPDAQIVVKNDVEVKTLDFNSTDEAYNGFLLQFHGANIAPFNNTKALDDLGYKGYYAWYNGTITTHVVLWKNNLVVVIKYTQTYSDRQESFLDIEKYVIEYLQGK
jgi:hypothetical protein